MFVFALVLLALTVAAVFVRSAATAPDVKGGSATAAAFLSLLTVGAFIIASTSIVPTRNVGIVVAFNKPTGRTTGAGLKMHAPWQSIDDWDASGQTFAHLGDQCVWVAIAAQRQACVPVQIEWNARADRAPENWAAYRETKIGDRDLSRFETFTERRVNPQINAALTTVFASFDPLGQVDTKTGDAPAPDLNKSHRDLLLNQIKANLGEDIEVRSIAFEKPGYDEPTTDAIAAYGQKILEARNLAIDEQNAKTRARITATDSSVNQTARCLQIAEKAGKEPGLCMNPLGALAVTK